MSGILADIAGDVGAVTSTIAIAAASVITLGGFTFPDASWSLPERINDGGEQKLIVHKLIGGTRIIDAMGPDDDAITWKGRFRGANALAYCFLLDTMRRQGAAVQFQYWQTSKTVVIKSFKWEFERFYECPYTIILEVLQDNIAAAGASQPSADEAMSSDVSLAQQTASGGSNDLQSAASDTANSYSTYGLPSTDGGVPPPTDAGATSVATSSTDSVGGGQAIPLDTSIGNLQTASTQSAALDGDAVDNAAAVQPGADPQVMAQAATTAPGQMIGASSGVVTGAVADRMGYNLGQAVPSL